MRETERGQKGVFSFLDRSDTGWKKTSMREWEEQMV